MKSNYFIYYLGLFLVLACTTENATDEKELLTLEGVSNFDEVLEVSRNTNSSPCRLLAAIVEESTCFSYNGFSGYTYSVYARGLSSQNNKPYDRRVDFTITDSNNSIIESNYVIIPANSLVSNNVDVFIGGVNTSRIGNVVVRITSVLDLSGQNILNDCSFFNTTFDVNNCYRSNGGGSNTSPCDGQDGVGPWGDDIINDEGDINIQSNDADGDGICSNIDTDDNNPCVPSPNNPACQG